MPALRVHPFAPNPTNRFTQFQYELSQPSGVRITIYDVTGRLVRTLVDSWQAPGVHPVAWDSRDNRGLEVPSGTYFMRIQAGALRHGNKVVLLR